MKWAADSQTGDLRACKEDPIQLIQGKKKQTNRERESKVCQQCQNNGVGSRTVRKQIALHCFNLAIPIVLDLSFLNISLLL